MRKVKITLPAALTNLGGAGLGLALSLYAVIEISERADNQLVVDTEGEGAGHYSIGLRHPVVLAMLRVFQTLERAPTGIHVKINNHIPVNSGLGAEAAFLVAGVIGGYNLLGSAYSRTLILETAARLSPQPDAVTTTLLGGMTAGILDGDSLVYRSIPVQAIKVVVVAPRIEGYAESARAAAQERIALKDAQHDLARVPLLVEGLRGGDVKLVSRALDDKLRTPALSARITGYKTAAEVARRAGAGVTISGSGPALVAFAESDHAQIGEAMVAAFAGAGVQASAWVLPVNTQGVVISAAQSA